MIGILREDVSGKMDVANGKKNIYLKFKVNSYRNKQECCRKNILIFNEKQNADADGHSKVESGKHILNLTNIFYPT
jgi:hypothetical protein